MSKKEIAVIAVLIAFVVIAILFMMRVDPASTQEAPVTLTAQIVETEDPEWTAYLATIPCEEYRETFVRFVPERCIEDYVEHYELEEVSPQQHPDQMFYN